MTTMDFFGRQENARRRTSLLVACLALAVAVMIAAIYLAVVVGLFFAKHRQLQQIEWYQPQLFAFVAIVTLAIIAVGSLYKTLELRGGGEQVAAMLDGKKINPATEVAAERRILNVVEEMAIASGMAVPPVYLLDKESGINAFAAGFTPDNAVIGISRGTLDHLSRDELQGVVAHEFSHILNGDMRFNLRLIGILHGILVIGLIGYYMLRLCGGSGRSSGSAAAKLAVGSCW